MTRRSDNPSGGDDGLTKLRRRVDREYRRISNAGSPEEVLNLTEQAGPEEINRQFEKIEGLFHPDRFEDFNDNELIRKAVEIRKMASRAVVEMQGKQSQIGSLEETKETTSVHESVDPDNTALGDIYFRDGVSWLKLEDYGSAIECFQRSIDYDPGRGLPLAYHAYARFQAAGDDPEVVKECRESFRTAQMLEPDNADLVLLKTRFGLLSGSVQFAEEGLRQLRQLEPGHPELGKLRRMLDEMR